MRNTVLMFATLCIFAGTACKIMPVTKIFILRHADRSSSSGEDISNPEGITRANELKRVLGQVRIDSIFSTNSPRTLHTVEPLALERGLSVIIYSTEEEVINRVRKNCRGKRVLIAGHSTVPNSVANLIRKCGCTPPSSIDPNIPGSQFDNLFLVLIEKDRANDKTVYRCKSIHMKYGAVTN